MYSQSTMIFHDTFPIHLTPRLIMNVCMWVFQSNKLFYFIYLFIFVKSMIAISSSDGNKFLIVDKLRTQLSQVPKNLQPFFLFECNGEEK